MLWLQMVVMRGLYYEKAIKQDRVMYFKNLYEVVLVSVMLLVGVLLFGTLFIVREYA
jgi:hypothetical protein